MRHRIILSSFCVLTLLILSSVGCSSLEKMPNPFSRSRTTPARAVAVWSPAARVVNGVPQRGFAGRVTFYNGKSKNGIKVDGDVVVYAYDEYGGRSVSENAPEKTYPFLADDLKKLHSKNETGHSYSLWVPWDSKGADGERKDVSLIVKLVPKEGSPVMSGQARCLLPGKETPEMFAGTTRKDGSGDITLAGYSGSRFDRNGNRLPDGFREWTKEGSRFGEDWTSEAEERMISNTTRPGRMSTMTINVPTSPQQFVQSRVDQYPDGANNSAQMQYAGNNPAQMQQVSQPVTQNTPIDPRFQGERVAYNGPNQYVPNSAPNYAQNNVPNNGNGYAAYAVNNVQNGQTRESAFVNRPVRYSPEGYPVQDGASVQSAYGRVPSSPYPGSLR
ncbi:MAG: hypothetical protein ACRC10_06995 [Thermoguttaceae bacterium]